MPIAYDTPIKTNAQSLERVLSVALPILLVFETPRCEPCSSLETPLKKLAQEFSGQALIVRIEDATQGGLQERYRLQRVPTLLLWKDGKEAGRIEGAAPEAALRQNLEFLTGRADQATAASGPSLSLSGGYAAPRGGDGASYPDHSPRSYTSPPPYTTTDTGTPLTVTDATFERDVLRSTTPVLVDFWAPWCGPCRMVSPIVEEFGRQYRGRLRVAKVNTDENPRYAGSLGIQGIPTLILFKGGREADRIVGAAPKPMLQQFIERNL
jgi:thioredoxin 1